MSRIVTVIRALIAALLLATPAALATVDKPLARGLDESQPQFLGMVDNVNLFSGNLSVRVPLGGEYSTNGTLKYSFALSYSSSVLDFASYSGVSTTAGHYFRQFQRFSSREYDPLGGDQNSYAESFPNPLANAGLGWMLTLGEMANGVTYVSSDGGVHIFTPSLHATPVPDAWNVTNPPGPLFTQDGSYLRMRMIPTTRSTIPEREIDFPDGRRMRFYCVERCTEKDHWFNQQRWLLDYMSDPYGNILYVERTLAGLPRHTRPPAGSEWRWKFVEATASSDGHATPGPGLTVVRSHEIDFRIARTYQEPGEENETDNTEMRAQQVRLAGPNGPLTYQLHYIDNGVHRNPQAIWKSTDSRVPLKNVLVDPYQPGLGEEKKSPVSFLERVVTPVTDTLIPSRAEEWKFVYDFKPADLRAPTSLDFRVSHYSGLLKRLILPTKGGIEYSYRTRAFPAAQCGDTKPDDFGAHLVAVHKRQLIDASQDGKVTDVGRPWLYLSTTDRRPKSPTSPGSTDCNTPREMAVFAMDPAGVLTTHYFSVYVDGKKNYDTRPPVDAWDRANWGANYTVAVGSATGGYLSRQVFRCTDPAVFDTVVPSIFAPDALRRTIDHLRLPSDAGFAYTCGQPFLTEYALYDSNYVPNGINGYSYRANERLVRRKLVYNATQETDPLTALATVDSEEVTIYEAFDGVGNFRRVITDGDFHRRNGIRTERTHYNRGIEWDAATKTVSGLPAENQPWMLTLFDRTSVEEVGSPSGPAVTEYQFDPNTGFLQKKRILGDADTVVTGPVDGASRAGTDILVTYTRSRGSAGEVTIDERYYGGDGANIGTAELSNTNPAGAPSYHVRRTLQAGVERREEFVCSTGPIAVSRDLTVHPGSGVATAARSVAGAETVYSYDSGGRIASVDPPGGGTADRFAFTYASAFGSSRASITMKRTLNNTDAEVSRATLDLFGRPATKEQDLPDGTTTVTACTVFVYRPDGKVQQVSTPGSCTTPRFTTYTYDPLGRVVKIEPPEGNPKRTEFWYGGRRMTKQVTHGTAVAGGSSGKFTFYDRQGRIARVEEKPLDSNPETFATAYTYDASGRLRKVEALNVSGQSSPLQTRTYTYDNRGFLLSRSEPELSGTMFFANHDALGRFRHSYIQGGTRVNELLYDYDAAGRLETVTDRANVPLKTFAYYPNTAAVGSKNLLSRATRRNWVPNPRAVAQSRDIPVETSYTYDSAGRLDTRKLVSPGSAAAVEFTTDHDYDVLGRLEWLRYPTFLANGQAVVSQRAVQHRYTLGALTAVVGFADPIRYHDNGMTKRVRHDNGVIDVFGKDGDNHRRIASIATEGAVTNWSTGAIVYDGAGHIQSIGADTFTYDRIGRLVTAAMKQPDVSQSYTYDRYGNLLTIGGHTLPVSTANNRLNTGAIYDAAGRLTMWRDARRSNFAAFQYEYDLLDKNTHLYGPAGVGKVFIYDAFGERVAVFDYDRSLGVLETWTVRGAGGRVLREVTHGRATIGENAAWRWRRDYVYRHGLLLASVTPSGTEHMHLDHLGTPRVLTDAGRQPSDLRKYLPYGEQLSGPVTADPLAPRLRFTGHERDDDNNGGTSLADVDYMHARYYGPSIGRFLTPDIIRGHPASPQSFNRYSYVGGDPIGFADPTGKTRAMMGSAGRSGVRNEKDDDPWDNGYDVVHDSIDVVEITVTASAPPVGVEIIRARSNGLGVPVRYLLTPKGLDRSIWDDFRINLPDFSATPQPRPCIDVPCVRADPFWEMAERMVGHTFEEHVARHKEEHGGEHEHAHHPHEPHPEGEPLSGSESARLWEEHTAEIRRKAEQLRQNPPFGWPGSGRGNRNRRK